MCYYRKDKIMVKLYCDKCGKEIKDKYYTVAFTEHYTMSVYSDGKLSTIDTYIRPTAFEELNSQKIYCSECKNKLELG